MGAVLVAVLHCLLLRGPAVLRFHYFVWLSLCWSCVFPLLLRVPQILSSPLMSGLRPYRVARCLLARPCPFSPFLGTFPVLSPVLFLYRMSVVYLTFPYSGGGDARDGMMLDATMPGLHTDMHLAAQSRVVSSNMAFHMTFNAICVEWHSQLFGVVGADTPRYCAAIDEHR